MPALTDGLPVTELRGMRGFFFFLWAFNVTWTIKSGSGLFPWLTQQFSATCWPADAAL